MRQLKKKTLEPDVLARVAEMLRMPIFNYQLAMLLGLLVSLWLGMYTTLDVAIDRHG